MISSIAYNKPNDGIAIAIKMKLGIKVQIISIVVLCVNFKFAKANILRISQ
jgi:hypothetical protein